MKKSLLFIALFFVALVLVGCGGNEVSFNKEGLTLQVGDKQFLEYTVSDEDAMLSWESSDDSVVDVDQFGYVRAISSGTAEITVGFHGTEVSATIKITVTEEPVIYKISVVIYNLDEEELFKDYIVFEDGDTLEALLADHEEIQMKGKTESFGFYITEMFGISSEDFENTFWNIKVNGEDSMVGISEIELVNGDELTFSHIGF